MKIAVLIMSTEYQPSLRNVEAFKNTVIKNYIDNIGEFKHEYDFWVYTAGNIKENEFADIDDPVNHFYKRVIKEEESVYRTWEKTYKMFCELISVKGEYDLYVRINISMWLNLNLLDAVAERFSDDVVYCNAINSHVNVNSTYVNDIYPRGDLYIFGNETMRGIIEHGIKYMYCDVALHDRIGVEHVDDCILGVVLIDIYGNDYYNHIEELRYMFIPTDSIYDMDRIDSMSIGFRVKTTPKGMQSGYSWDDNEYRLKDSAKMVELQEYFNENKKKYSNIKIRDVVVDDEHERPTLFVQATNCSVRNVFKKYLSMKRN